MTGYDTTTDYDTAAQEAALRLITLRGGELRGPAAQALGIKNPAARQVRLDRLIPKILTRADLTDDEVQTLVSALYPAPATDPGTRTDTIRVRVTRDQRITIEDAARAEGRNVSDYIRAKLLGDTP